MRVLVALSGLVDRRRCVYRHKPETTTCCVLWVQETLQVVGRANLLVQEIPKQNVVGSSPITRSLHECWMGPLRAIATVACEGAFCMVVQYPL